MVNETYEILEKVLSLPIEERKRFASHKSKAIARKKMSESDAIFYAWKRLGIIGIQHTANTPPTTSRPPLSRPLARSWLDRWIREGA